MKVFEVDGTDTLFRIGNENKQRHINVGNSYEALGTKRAATIHGLRSFTGCVFTSKFNGESKSSC